MALTKGEQHTLYYLLSTASYFRGVLEGTLSPDGGASLPLGAPTTQPDFLTNRLYVQARRIFGYLPNFSGNAGMLFVPPVAPAPGNITTDRGTIMKALDMATYTPNNPCPKFGEDVVLAAAIVPAPFPMLAQTDRKKTPKKKKK
jgi:hypothetical protein